MERNYEEFKVWGDWKLPIEGVQYAMGGGGVSFGVGKSEKIADDDLQAVKQKMVDSFIAELEKELKTRSKAVIDALVKKEIDKALEEKDKQLEKAREEYIKLRDSKNG